MNIYITIIYKWPKITIAMAMLAITISGISTPRPATICRCPWAQLRGFHAFAPWRLQLQETLRSFFPWIFSGFFPWISFRWPPPTGYILIDFDQQNYGVYESIPSSLSMTH